jgi:hypothetical protein
LHFGANEWHPAIKQTIVTHLTYNHPMRITATNAHEASQQILRIIYTTDLNQSHYRPNPYGATFVYFSIKYCRYSFSSMQQRDAREMIKRYQELNCDDVLHVTACKYSFSQIAISAILNRKIMTHREFFEIAREHFDWLK